MRCGSTAISLALVGVALVGCGGSGGGPRTDATSPDATDDETVIRRTITDLSTKADPALCTEALTENWIDEAYPPAGEGAIDECRRQQKPDAKLVAQSVDFGEIEIDGNTAKATFAEVGPGVGGSESTVSLLQDGAGVWRVDDLLAVKITDEAEFLDSVRVSSSYGQGGASPEQADCLAREIGEIPHHVLERRAVTADRSLPVPIVAECVGEGTAPSAVVELIRRFLAEDREYAKFSDCASQRVGKLLNATQARDFLAQEDRDTVQLLVARALASCGAGPALGPDEGATV